jgi:hypothetical protein
MPQLQGFYVSFSGESSDPINNVYALSPSGDTVSTQVLDPGQTYDELRGMAFGPDGLLYVCQAHKTESKILAFAATANGSHTRAFEGVFAAGSSSPGLLHPYQPIFDADGNLYVSSQDTNVVTGYYGPKSTAPGKEMPLSTFLQAQYPTGTFNSGTFVPAESADPGVPTFTSVPGHLGGLALTSNGSTHSVRGIAFDNSGRLYVADEAKDRVNVYDRDGNLLGEISQSNNHSIQNPVALWFDGNRGLVYIGSPGNGRIFTYDVTSSGFQANSLINDDDRLDKVSGITVDPDGNIYTCSRETCDIYQWSPGGSLLGTFAKGFNDTPEQIIPVFSGF